MPTTARFTKPALAELDRAKILGIRAGKDHRYIGIWVVVIEGRVFVRSWNDKPTGWFQAFKAEPAGSIQVGDREIRIRGKQVRSQRIRDAVTNAFAEKYHTPGSQKWVQGFAEPERSVNTLELVPMEKARSSGGKTGKALILTGLLLIGGGSRASAVESSHSRPIISSKTRSLANAERERWQTIFLTTDNFRRAVARMRQQVLPPAPPIETQLAMSFEERFHSQLFAPDRTPEQARRRLDASLAGEIDSVEKVCGLTGQQIRKLELMGHGDIRRFFDACESLKLKLAAAVAEANPRDLGEAVYPLQHALQSGLFHRESLFHRAIPNTLTAEQFLKYDAMLRESARKRHRSAIDDALRRFEQAAPLDTRRRQALLDLILAHTRPSRQPGPYELMVLASQFEQIPEKSLRPLLDEAQWESCTRLLNEGKRFEPMLRQLGYMPEQAEPKE